MRFRRIKTGQSTMRKYQERALNTSERMPLSMRRKLHSQRNPNDKNESKVRGVINGKKGNSYNDLMEFHKNHIWTFIDSDMNKGWVNINGEEE